MQTYILGCGMSTDKVAQHHNRREGELPKNVDPTLIKDNVVLIDKIGNRTIEQWINDDMQQHMDAYNAKQKQKCRRKEMTYVEWHASNKLYTQNKNIKSIKDLNLAREFVLSYGGHDTIGGEYFSPLTSPERKKQIYDQAVRLFTKWIDDMKEAYPHIEIGQAIIHADEPRGSIHLHGIISARATYDRGIPCQCCWSRALEQDGIEKIKEKEIAEEEGGFQLARFYKQFREHMAQDLEKEWLPGDDGDMVKCFEIKEEEHGKEHIASNAYTELMEKATQKMENAKVILKKAEEKAEQAMNFTKIVERVKEEVEKTIDVQDSSVIYETRKDSMFGEKYEVAVQRKEAYEAKAAGAVVNDAIGKLTMHAERIEMASKKAIEEIQTEGRAEAEREIERLKGVVAERDKTIKTLENKISVMQDYVDHVLEFLKELNMVQRWQAFWNRVTRNRRQEQHQEFNHDERKDREQ